MIYSPNTTMADGLEPGTDSMVAQLSPPAPVEPQSAEKPAQPSPAAQELLAVINADREARERAARNEAEAASYKSKYEEAAAKLADFDKAKGNALLDSMGYLRKLGYSDAEAATFAEGIMYSLVPGKAPPDFRAKVVEAQMKLRDRQDEDRTKQAAEEAKRQEANAIQERGKQIELQYAQGLRAAAQNFKPGAYSASQAWFGTDHDKYAESLFLTAREMAEAAQRAGGRSDLTPDSVAKTLEAKMIERANRFVSFAKPGQPQTRAAEPNLPRSQAEPQAQAPTVPPDGVFSISSDSRITKQTLTDAERIRRAAEAGFAAPRN